MKKSVLKVQMFGSYEIEYEGNPVSFERNTTTKTNQLMQILLQAGEKGVTRAKLLSDLFGNEEMSNPANSLRATVFRLRRLLAAAGLPEDEYVTIRGGSYYWTSGIPYELDAHRFEDLLDKAGKENDLEKKKSYIEEACELYRGEFLLQLGAEGWAVVLNVYYKNLFSNAMRTLCQILKDEKDYKKLYHCAEKQRSSIHWRIGRSGRWTVLLRWTGRMKPWCCMRRQRNFYIRNLDLHRLIR